MPPLYQVDAFCDVPFKGNPAAVCLLPGPRDAVWMQQVATEMNLSETAFLHPEADGLRLRWFTPVAEVELCGHATLASAHVLWETGTLLASQQIQFNTLSGVLTADQSGGEIWLDFPTRPVAPVQAPPSLLEGLGCEALFVGRTRYDAFVEIESATSLRKLKPDIQRLHSVDARGIIVTCRSDCESADFLSRFFAPRVGVPEDPVTGSAHCSLAPYWAGKLSKTVLTGYQASARGGTVRVEVRGDRVRLGGRAVTILKGELV